MCFGFRLSSWKGLVNINLWLCLELESPVIQLLFHNTIDLSFTREKNKTLSKRWRSDWIVDKTRMTKWRIISKKDSWVRSRSLPFNALPYRSLYIILHTLEGDIFVHLCGIMISSNPLFVVLLCNLCIREQVTMSSQRSFLAYKAVAI